MAGSARLALLLGMLLIAGCAAKDILATDSAGYVPDAARRVAGIDWSRAEMVDVALSEYEFTPATLRFAAGRPYRLRLENRGTEAHDFASKPFFEAIAAARLVEPGRTVPLPRLVSIGVAAGATKEVDFVAVKPGSYPFQCNEPLHALLGMTGLARIE